MLDNLQSWFNDVETVLLTLLVVIAVWVIIRALASGNRSWTRALILIPIAVLVVWGASNIESLTGPIEDEFNDVFGAASLASVVTSTVEPGSLPGIDASVGAGHADGVPAGASSLGGGSAWMK